MSSIKIPGPDAQLKALLKTFNSGMETYSTTLGFDAGDEAAVLSAQENFDTAYDANVAAKAAAKGAAATKNSVRADSVSTIRDYAARVKANPAVTPEIIAAFGMDPEPTVSGPVSVPTELIATPSVLGTAELKWKRNGNASGTVFVLQSKSETGAWTIFATTTKTKFTDNNAPLSVAKWYRVRAERNGVVSSWSTDVSIYSSGGGESLTLAA